MDQKEKCKKTVFVLAGVVSLVLGITLILAWWPNVVILFQGMIGIVLALLGILLLYIVRI